MSEFKRDVLDGLSGPQKSLPSRWLYDARGSDLFEQITALPEYYPTRTETAILRDHAQDIAAYVGPDASLVEYGAGASVKTRILLDALDRPAAYLPVDVSADFLRQSASALSADYPELRVQPVVANFLGRIDFPPFPSDNRAGFFPGSTIGNLDDAEMETFLRRAADRLGDGAAFILGYDRIKDESVLIEAYDDAQGVTAAFNLNLLTRINHELGADFDVAAFRHEARWNADQARIEMHLVSEQQQSVTIDGSEFCFDAGESIHTENSRKFADGFMSDMAARAGWSVDRVLDDPDGLFAVALMRRQ